MFHIGSIGRLTPPLGTFTAIVSSFYLFDKLLSFPLLVRTAHPTIKGPITKHEYPNVLCTGLNFAWHERTLV